MLSGLALSHLALSLLRSLTHYKINNSWVTTEPYYQGHIIKKWNAGVTTNFATATNYVQSMILEVSAYKVDS